MLWFIDYQQCRSFPGSARALEGGTGLAESLTGNLRGENLIWMLGNFPEVDRKKNAPAQLCAESTDPQLGSTDLRLAGNPSFSCIHSGSLCRAFPFSRTRGLLTSLSHTELWDAHPSAAPLLGKLRQWSGPECFYLICALHGGSGQIPGYCTPNFKCSRGSCTPGTANQQSSP